MRSSDTPADASVFHLVWAPLGLGPFEGFLASYEAHTAGAAHRLCILFNGFEADADLGPYKALLRGLDHDSLMIPGAVQDIAAYLIAARQVESTYLMFLNSYSRILGDGWLEIFLKYASQPRIGVVGATGSYESRTTAYRQHLLDPVRWRPPVARSLFDLARGRVSIQDHPYLGWTPYWVDYPLFPNVHIRTNSFMVRRRDFLRLKALPIRTKEDAYFFESGRRGMTRQMLARGLKPVVVGRDGIGYRVKDWPGSGTYRSGNSRNLLVSDNQTRSYSESDAETRGFLARLAWGEGGMREGLDIARSPACGAPE